VAVNTAKGTSQAEVTLKKIKPLALAIAELLYITAEFK